MLHNYNCKVTWIQSHGTCVYMYASYLSTKRAQYFVVIRRQGCYRKCIVSTASNLQAVEYLTSMVHINTVPTIFEALCHAFSYTLCSWEGNSAWWLQSLWKKKIKFYMTVLHYMDKLKNFKFSLEIQCTSLSQWMCKQNYCHSYISAPGHHVVTLYQ